MRYNFKNLYLCNHNKYLFMVQIIARESKNKNAVSLYVRIYKRGVINNAISLGVALSKQDWLLLDGLLRNALQAEKSGGTVSLRDNLAISLLKIVKTIDASLEMGSASVDEAKFIILNELRKDEQNSLMKYESFRESSVKAEASRMTLKKWITEYIRQCETGERLKRKSTWRITAGTIKNYRGTLSQLEAYEKDKHCVLDWDDMTMDFYDSWKAYFIKKQYSPNTIGRHIKNLKTFLFAAKEMKLTTTTDFESNRFVAAFEDVDNVYLTKERICQMYNFDPMDRKQIDDCINSLPVNDRKRLRELTRRPKSLVALSKVKDVFLVGCLTGQRVSDYKRMTSDMIVKLKDGRKYISIRQEKTHKEIFIPLDERVIVILDKYGGALPKIRDQKLNEHIKTVGHLLGWTEKAGVRELHGSMTVDKGKRFYECIKTHTARRTFATNAYKDGVSLSSIMAVTGHSSELMLRKYLKLDNKERAMLAAAEFERAKEVKLKIAE